MKLLVTIPVINQFELGRISLAQWDWMTSPATDFLLIDNGGSVDWPSWLQTAHLRAPQRWHILRNEANAGIPRSAQQAYQWTLKRGYDLLALAHNDVWVWEPSWDVRARSQFTRPETGALGFFGSKGCSLDGLRLSTFGNVLDSGHGRRMTSAFEPACILEGFFQCYRMTMLQEAGGFDQNYQWMHIYDYDASLTSLSLGYQNVVLNIPCHHLSGLTANNDAKSTSGQDVMQRNIDYFHQKWDSKLGVHVGEDFSIQWGLGQ